MITHIMIGNVYLLKGLSLFCTYCISTNELKPSDKGYVILLITIKHDTILLRAWLDGMKLKCHHDNLHTACDSHKFE